MFGKTTGWVNNSEVDLPIHSPKASETNKSKWTQPKYSRTERERRKRENSISVSQTYIDDFFPIINQLDELIKENNDLKKLLQQNLQHSNVKSDTNSEEFVFSFLNDLKEMALQNGDKNKYGNRFNDNIKLFATYIFIIAGRQFYEIVQQNLPLPSLSSISSYMKTELPTPIEANLRIKELSEFLDKNKLKRCVWISEDATKIVEKLEYDISSNQIIGFVLPINNDTGFPVPHAFPANSALDIFNMFQNQQYSTFVNVIIAQTFTANSSENRHGASFCLSIFGTNNRFCTTEVIKRWKYLIQQLESNNIRILGK